MNVMVIPTHRNTQEGIDSAVQEIYRASREQGSLESWTLLVVDNGPHEIAEVNRSYLEMIGKKTGIQVAHYNFQEQEQIARSVARHMGGDEAELLDLLLPSGVDYGKIFNMIYLLVVMMGGSSFHRRDSDCFVDELIPSHYPIVGEMRYLGKTVKEVKGDFDTTRLSLGSQNEEILITGSDYYGNWNLDMESLAQHDPGVIDSLLDIFGIPDSGRAAYIASKYPTSTEIQQRHPVLIKDETIPDYPDISPSYPECGNLSMQEVFRYIPNFVGRHAIGFDYHTYIVSSLLRIPVVYHTRRIVHRHDRTRKRPDQLMAYWRGIVKQADYNMLLSGFMEGPLEQFCRIGKTGKERLERLDWEAFADCLQACRLQMDRRERVRHAEQVIERVLRPSPLSEYQWIADQLQEQKEQLIDELDSDYDRSIRLQRLWPNIMRAARALHLGKQGVGYG
jgi:hypothetical protein